ncbi:hypothetical protein, variant [Puccinia graminis f. sp. tritici CRL 75-36-700-3]|uniref:Uncharacterized protein n=1 Tax=Puccinia graminis f. sp. tritici (strain CRL 75-36-700-3 / race SCCL) TaxID=418459 RepID=H6QST5_PUCGT|nr:hypothetical protein, variant [Puccinia graminis f. sp. tritici CRL 75-36-700-3]EHS63828.1 hypothetical protein, variant [Puccinia graminis f. sp. tritici CRL 75-36-700-3]
MDVESFDPRAPRVGKQSLIDFLYQNESTIRLRSSLSKSQLIHLVDEQKERLRLNHTQPVVDTRTLQPTAGGTRTSPRRRSTPHLAPVVNTDPDTIEPVSDSTAPTPSAGDPNSIPTDPVGLVSVAGELHNQEERDEGSLSDSLQDPGDEHLTQWNFIVASKTFGNSNTGKDPRTPDDHIEIRFIQDFDMPAYFPAILQETQQLPGAFPIDLSELSAKYPPTKLLMDVPLSGSYYATESISVKPFTYPVMTIASRHFVYLIKKTLLKLHHFSFVTKHSKQPPTSSTDDQPRD